MGIVHAPTAREVELEAEITHLRNLLHEAGENAERGTLLLAQSDEEHHRTRERFTAAAERQGLHMAELGHRLRNTISLVQAIANQSLRSATSLDAAREALDLRLVALWRVHEALLADDWTSASVAAVVAGVTSLHGVDQSEHFVLDGDAGVQLDAQAALGLGLALHELATNAAKYGALSREGGQVRLRWRRVRRGTAGELVLSWSEHGGPMIPTAPRRRGFGSRLIVRSLASVGGEADLTFRRSGLVCRLRMPLAALPIC